MADGIHAALVASLGRARVTFRLARFDPGVAPFAAAAVAKTSLACTLDGAARGMAPTRRAR